MLMEDERCVFYMIVFNIVVKRNCVLFNSVGCGRIGFFIVVYYLCEEVLKECKVYVFECVKRMRE